MPMSPRALGVVLREVVARNRIGYGIVYLQITRGVARRDHAFPSPQTAPSMVVTARPLNMARNEALAAKGIAVVSVPDNRWGRVDIKTVGLLPNVLARQAAIEQGARDAWFVDNDGSVTEAASANAWIVTRGRHAGHAACRSRHPARHHARASCFDVVKAQGLTVEERAFTLEEAYAAREAFDDLGEPDRACRWCSIDGHVIGDGKPGPVATALRREFHRYAERGRRVRHLRPDGCLGSRSSSASQLGLASPAAAPSNESSPSGWLARSRSRAAGSKSDDKRRH